MNFYIYVSQKKEKEKRFLNIKFLIIYYLFNMNKTLNSVIIVLMIL